MLNTQARSLLFEGDPASVSSTVRSGIDWGVVGGVFGGAVRDNANNSVPDKETVDAAINKADTDGGASLAAAQERYEAVPSTLKAHVIKSNKAAESGEPSGDLARVLLTDDGQLHLLSGDVAGHGVESGKLSVRLNQIISDSIPELTGQPPQDWLARLEPAVQKPDGSMDMAMMSHVAIDPATGEAHVATAGQNLTYRLQPDGTVTMLNTRGAPLGVGLADMLSANPMQLGQGDMIIMGSDGMYSKFGDDHGEAFEEYLRSLGPQAHPQQIADAIASRTAQRPDDASFIVYQWPGSGSRSA
jgi:hypothetical protein